MHSAARKIIRRGIAGASFIAPRALLVVDAQNLLQIGDISPEGVDHHDAVGLVVEVQQLAVHAALGELAALVAEGVNDVEPLERLINIFFGEIALAVIDPLVEEQLAEFGGVLRSEEPTSELQSRI